MPQISVHEFERLPLRVHDFLAGVPLHDVWAIDLPGTRAGITLDEFLRTASARSRVSCDCCKNDRGRKGVLPLLNVRIRRPTEYGAYYRPRDWPRWYQGILENCLVQA